MIASVVILVAMRPPIIVTTLDIDTAFVSIPLPATMPITVAIPVAVVVALDDDGFFSVGRRVEWHGEADDRKRRRSNDETPHLCFSNVSFYQSQQM
jgi:hypothetical protein